jgi:hypothetical protein
VLGWIQADRVSEVTDILERTRGSRTKDLSESSSVPRRPGVSTNVPEVTTNGVPEPSSVALDRLDRTRSSLSRASIAPTQANSLVRGVMRNDSVPTEYR